MTERDPDQPLTIVRFICWALAACFGVAAAIFTGFHWSGTTMPTGLVSWLVALMTLSVIIESKVHLALDRRRLAGELVKEIRVNKPPDAIELARVSATQLKIVEWLSEISGQLPAGGAQPAAAALRAEDPMEAELRGFLSAQLHRDDRPDAQP